MNHNKKRKRQSGRQSQKVQDCYKVWIDEAGKISSTLYKERCHKLYPQFTYMKSVTKEEFAQDYT